MEDGMDNNVIIVEKAARCRCKVLQKALAREGLFSQ
jgi:hypothetical protein